MRIRSRRRRCRRSPRLLVLPLHMGAISTLLFVDVAALTTRVVPALLAWVETAELARFWHEALVLEHRPPPAAADRAVLQAAFLDREQTRLPGGLVVPGASLQEETRGALEIAVLTASRGDGLAIGNATWLTIDAAAALPGERGRTFDEILAGADPPAGLGTLLHALDQGASGYAVGAGATARACGASSTSRRRESSPRSWRQMCRGATRLMWPLSRWSATASRRGGCRRR